MAQSIRPASIVRDVAVLMKTNRRAAAAIAASQVPVPAKDRLVITTNGQPATWQLSALPYTGDLGSSLNMSLNGLELDEATDYSVDYTTGLVTFSSAQQALFAATPAPADTLTADYWTTDELIANAQPADTGVAPPTIVGTAVNSGNGTTASCPVPAGYQAGDLMLLSVSALNADTNMTTPTGWTLVNNPVMGSGLLAIYKRTATSSESTVTVTRPSTGGDWVAEMRVYRGLSNTPPVASYGVSWSNTTSNNAASVSYTGDAMVVTIWGLSCNFDAGTLTPDAGLSNVVNRSNTTLAQASGDQQVTLTGTTPSRTCTTNSGFTVNGWNGATVVLGAA